MNFFHHFYPSLLKVPGFLLEFITPIVKATKGTRVRFFVLSYVVSGLSFEVDDEKNSSSSKFSFLNSKKKNRSSPFTPCLSTKPGGRSAAGPPGGRSSTTKVIFGLFLFSLAEKSEERVDKREEGKKLTQGPEQNLEKSHGLGTSTEKEAKAYFSRIDSHRKRFVWHDDAEDGGALELAFSKKKIEERKAWLAAVEPGTFLDQSQPEIGYSDFVHRELVLFSRADLER